MIAYVVVAAVPLAGATVVRPDIWAFPKPWFRAQNEVIQIPSGRGDLSVRVVGARGSAGVFRLGLYRGGLEGNEAQIASQVVPASSSVVTFPDVAWSEYAVIGYHDANNNETLDFEGNRPSEDLIETGAASHRPEYEDLKFVFDRPAMLVEASMVSFR